MSARKLVQKPCRLLLGREERGRRPETFLGGRLQVSSSRGVHGPERVLLDCLDQEMEGRVLVAGSREGLLALAAARLFPSAEVHLFQMDSYELHRARATLAANGAVNARFRLGADLPDPGSFDWVMLPVPERGDAMLAGDLLRQAHAALKPRGKLMAGTDNSHDKWLHTQVLEVFGAATIHLRSRAGMVYIARKQPGRRTRPRDYSREFKARLFGRDLVLRSRPGVFSHGELDQGTLALAEAAAVSEDSRVLDLGSGSGALGIAAALAAPRGRALLVDSSARAARVARENVKRCGAEPNALVILAHDLQAVRGESFDLALANPPYYSDHRITQLFAREGRRTLAPGGEFLLVTKSPERPSEIIGLLFGEYKIEERRGYAVIRARKEK
jgi:16S rRNA (guanine1207-N2)-methyltransferase